MKLTQQQILTVAQSIGADYASFMAFIMTESSGVGFDTVTGKVIIRFELSWFVRKLSDRKISYSLNGATITSKGITFTVSNANQKANWDAFNQAWKIDQTCAMLATSWGMMQVMGFNYSTCGFHTVDDFVTAMRSGELGQIQAAAQFILHNAPLLAALKAKNWKVVAYYYNGAKYAVNHYDTHLETNYNKYLNTKL